MIDAAEASGELKPGGTIVEPTSGNTGVGLALVAQQRGYKCVFVCPDKVSEDKQNVLRAYGAEVVVCPTAVAPDHPDSYYSVSDRLVEEIDGAWKPDQYSNPNGPGQPLRDHRSGDLGRHRRHGHPLRRRRRHRRHHHRRRPLPQGGLRAEPVHVVGADPEGSVYSGGTGRPYLVEGVGEDFWPSAYDPYGARRDHRGLRRRLVRHDPAAGPRGGHCWSAAPAGWPWWPRSRSRSRLGPDALVVVLLPDGGRGYLSKIFNDAWMSSYGFLRNRLDGSVDEPSVGDVLRRKSRRAAGPGAHPPVGDGARRDRDPARVRRLADAGGARRAAR